MSNSRYDDPVNVPDALRQAVENNDFKVIRDLLTSAFMGDRTGRTVYPIRLQYCLDCGLKESEIFEKHDNVPLKIEVTAENFSELLVGLSNNFSKERVEARIIMGRKLYPHEGLYSSKSEKETTEEKHEEKRKTNNPSGNLIILAAGIGVIILILGLGVKMMIGLGK